MKQKSSILDTHIKFLKMVALAACIGLISAVGIYNPVQVGLYSLFVMTWVVIGILIKYYERMAGE